MKMPSARPPVLTPLNVIEPSGFLIILNRYSKISEEKSLDVCRYLGFNRFGS
jgi:hypothetical protein